MEIDFKAYKHGIWIFPTIGVGNQQYYYGYPVIVINFVWIKWQVFFKLGVKKLDKLDF